MGEIGEALKDAEQTLVRAGSVDGNRLPVTAVSV